MQRSENTDDHVHGTSQGGGARSSPGLSQHPRRFDESWVEVSSQPSSSSLSSIGEEIVTTGLQVGGQYGRRRRMPTSARTLPQQHTALYTAGASSQDGDCETDSDADADDDDDGDLDGDRPLTSSTENIPSEEAESDDGDDATALGGRVADRPIFNPQPNVFSRTPAYPHRSYSSNAAMAPHPHGGFTRPSFAQRTSRTRTSQGGPAFMSPSAREDSEEALWASLTTLLSCAAAARGLPKSQEEAEAQRRTRSGVGPSNQPVDLRLVPESDLVDEGSAPPPQPATTPTTAPARKRSSPTHPPSRAGESSRKSRRGASASRSSRTTKKKTAAAVEETFISPTLLTWVVSAGVVVLVSVVGFGAGYVIGREVGRQDALAASVSSVNETTSCGREAIRGSSGTLRRFKWGAVGRSIVA